jgi:hypothetical protein
LYKFNRNWQSTKLMKDCMRTRSDWLVTRERWKYSIIGIYLVRNRSSDSIGFWSVRGAALKDGVYGITGSDLSVIKVIPLG